MALCWTILLFPPQESVGSILNPVRDEGAPFPYLIGAAWTMFWNMHAKWTLYVYILFPVLFWQATLSILWPRVHSGMGKLMSGGVWALVVVAICALQSMVVRGLSVLWRRV